MQVRDEPRPPAPAPPPRRTPLAPHNARTALPLLVDKPSTAATEEERRECKICLDAPRAVRFVGCGHSCVCVECDEMLRGLPPDRRRCPLCNELIKEPSEEVMDPTKTFRAPKEAPIKTKAEDGAKGAPRRALEDLGLEYNERVLSRGATRHAARPRRTAHAFARRGRGNIRAHKAVERTHRHWRRRKTNARNVPPTPNVRFAQVRFNS